jgi:NMD protein affecting ribosome stability and mRNA decay
MCYNVSVAAPRNSARSHYISRERSLLNCAELKLTVRRTVGGGGSEQLLQQRLVVTFTVADQQCNACARSYTDHVWKCVVQVRQRVKHKRTFFHLEQRRYCVDVSAVVLRICVRVELSFALCDQYH